MDERSKGKQTHDGERKKRKGEEKKKEGGGECKRLTLCIV